MEIVVDYGILERKTEEIKQEMDRNAKRNLGRNRYYFDGDTRGMNWKEYQEEFKFFDLLDNFIARFPGGHYRDPNSFLAALDQDAPHSETGKPYNSPLYLSQTDREFYEVIDQVRASYGLTKKTEYRTIQKRTRTNRYKLIFPVYCHLIALGYNEYDLTP